tara:strand:+ start:1136 stop:2785 length:1650 start_codon:yes stop_codon:yes gene_type:complete
MKYSVFEKQILDFLSQDPAFCSHSGLDQNLGDLPDPGKNQRIKVQGKIKMFRGMIKSVETDLKEEEKDLKLWDLYLEQMRLKLEVEINGVPKIMRLPKAFSEIIDPIFLLMINDPRPAKQRIVNIISKLNKSMSYIQSYVRNIKEPVQRWVDMELEALSQVDSIFESLQVWAVKEGFIQMNALEKSIIAAKSALQFYKNFLNDVTKSKDFHLGENQMREIIKARGIDLTPSEIHQLAKVFLKENQAMVEELRKKLCLKYRLAPETSAAELQSFLAQKFSVPFETFEDIIQRYEHEQSKILNWLKQKNLFPIIENQSLKIMQTPVYLQPSIPAGAMICPLGLREGTRHSLIYLTLKETNLAEHTELSIPNMMIHEGIPGHHLHLATATTHKSVIRRIMPCNDLAEGWTTMLEDYILDQGFGGELEDELRFSAKRDMARLGARVAIDLFFMSGEKDYLEVGIDADISSDDPFESAGQLLQAVTGFVPDRVQGELNWYSQESGYPLSYLVGNHLMLTLKSKYLRKVADDDFSFHKFILSQGKMPLSFFDVST